jgi:AraC-like DNA-binding protein
VFVVQTYVEHAPHPALAGRVRTVWIQRADADGYVQRNLPTGGIEIHGTLGDVPRVFGPLTTAVVEAVPPGSVTIGVRFHPGAGTPLLGRLPTSDVLDETPLLSDLRGRSAVQLGDALAAAPTPEDALSVLQRFVAQELREAPPADPLVSEAVTRLMPGRPAEVADVAQDLAISRSQLRRRCVAALGVGPKTLQRTLRFQAYLALAQAASQEALRLGDRRTASLAALAGYADQPHLVRECSRLAGVTPTDLLQSTTDRCGCGHDHTASFRSFLPGSLLGPEPQVRHSFKTEPERAS